MAEESYPPPRNGLRVRGEEGVNQKVRSKKNHV